MKQSHLTNHLVTVLEFSIILHDLYQQMDFAMVSDFEDQLKSQKGREVLRKIRHLDVYKTSNELKTVKLHLLMKIMYYD